MIMRSKNCPACGAPLEFLENSNQTQCPYCRTWLTDESRGKTGLQETVMPQPAGHFSATEEQHVSQRLRYPTGWLHLLLAPSGRIMRRQFWLGLGVVAAILWLRTFFLAPALEPAAAKPNVIATLLLLLALWIFLVVQIKRFRDRGKPGWWTVVWLLPFGFVWVLYELGFKPSQQTV